MKNLKRTVFYLLLIAVASLGAAFKVNDAKRFTTVTFGWVGSVFSMGDPSGFLNNGLDWNSSNPMCGGIVKNRMCKVTVYAIGATPAEQDVIYEVMYRYILNGDTFSDGETWNAYVGGYNVSITVYLKSF